MIYREKIMAALEHRRADFAHFDGEQREQAALYGKALDRLAALTREQLLARLLAHDSPGAEPTAEFDLAPSGVIPFRHEWGNHDEARAWAFSTLIGRTTFASDGSQILPSKDYSVPVAAVQVGWFENSHTSDGAYVKDAAFEIIPPAEVLVRTGGATEISEEVVQRRRYGMEIAAARNFMLGTALRGFDPATPPVVFYDSLLVISFAEMLPGEQRRSYVEDILSLLAASKQTGIPVVGYVDTSFARDLVNMLQAAFGLDDAQKIHDAALLSRRMKWGDRTPVFKCCRRGILDDYGEEWKGGIGFVYLKTAGDAPPSRLDVPLWVYERGLLDYVIDTVRGEVVVGNGYPYVIEAADQTAVITGRDREVFYAVFQEFADRERLGFHVAHKAISKAHRR